MRYCVFCGVEIPLDAKYCQICGKRQPESDKQAVTAPEEQAAEAEGSLAETEPEQENEQGFFASPRNLMIAGGSAFVVLIGLVTFVIVLLKK